MNHTGNPPDLHKSCMSALHHRCGRIGRLAFRLAFDRPDDFEIVHLNEIAAAESTAYLIQFDSVHGEHRRCLHVPSS